MRKEVIAGLFVILILVSAFNFYFVLQLKSPKTTGSVISSGSVSLILTGLIKEINITSPLNMTYNFNYTEDYILDLNVTPIYFNASNWRYDLWDLKNGIKVNDTIAFFPNISFEVVRGSNKLVVYADDNDTGDIINKNVTFYINVSNTAPIIDGLNSTIYVCEDDSLSYLFNVTDYDGDEVVMGISPVDLFFLDTRFTNEGDITSDIELYSGTLDKDSVGAQNGWNTFLRTLSANDGIHVDTKDINITVIEINHAPVVERIGVQTVWTQGDDSTFYYQVQVEDKEDGSHSSGNLNFNISFDGESLFEIGSTGFMSFSPNSSQVGNHNITICVTDSGLNNSHENLSLYCGTDDSPLFSCEDFTLTVTDENRAPTIIDYYPSSLSLSINRSESLYFNITKNDPDGTIPDTYWYVDGVRKEVDSGSLIDEFSYSFGCGGVGNGIVSVEITDGLLNDSLQWNISYSAYPCPTPSGGGSGGGGVSINCSEKWGCDEWSVCQNAKNALELGYLSGNGYRIVKDKCEELNFEDRYCGVQVRTCVDVNECGTTYIKPDEFGSCYYTEDPSCNDGIKNCHSGSCELLVDCGGPCPPCPTCSDGIKNQGEEGVDCGGPCPWKCEVEKVPLMSPLKNPKLWYLFIIILGILLLIILFRIKRIIEYIKSKQTNF